MISPLGFAGADNEVIRVLGEISCTVPLLFLEIHALENKLMYAFFQIFFTRQFFIYLVFGGIAAVVNLACGYAFYTYTSLPYMIAIFLAAACGLLVNFLLNYFFNFIYRGRPMLSQLKTFTCIAMIGTLLTALIASGMLCTLNVLNVKIDFLFITPKFVAQFISVGMVTLYSFICHKYFSFNEGIIQRCKNVLKRSRNA